MNKPLSELELLRARVAELEYDKQFDFAAVERRINAMDRWQAIDFARWDFRHSTAEQNAKIAERSASCLVGLASGVSAVGRMMLDYDAGTHPEIAEGVGYLLKNLGDLMATIASNTCEGIEKSGFLDNPPR